MKTRSMLAIVCLMLALCARPASAGKRLDARIVDDANGKPLAARVSLAPALDRHARQGLPERRHPRHLPAPGEALLQMRGEDLNVANLLALGGLDVPANGHFTGRLHAGSTPGCELYVGQEIQEWQMGHLTLLGLTSMVPGYPNPGGRLEYSGPSNPHWDVVRAMRAAREQNGLVS